jgi:hypothetical protein
MPIALVAVVAIVAGCGGSNKAATSAATKAPSTTSAAAPSFTSATHCQALAGVGTKFAQAMSAASRGGKFDLQTAVSAYQALASAAPAQIRPDVQLMAQAFSSFAAALSKAGYVPGKVPSPAQLAGLTTAAKIFSQPKLRAAGQRLSAWAHQNCG